MDNHSLSSQPRLYFLDNLKVFLMMIVIAYHVGLAYVKMSSFWFIHNAQTDLSLGYVLALSRPFFLSLFFLISGYFIPLSLDHKGTWKYILDRIIRLGIPVLFFLSIINPCIEYFYFCHCAKPPFTLSFFYFYLHVYWNLGSHPIGLEQYHRSPAQLMQLWFISLLLLFSLGYALFHHCSHRFKAIGHNFNQWSFHQILAITIILSVAATYLIEFWYPVHQWVNWIILSFRPVEMPRHLTFFILGIVMYRCHVLLSMPKIQGFIWLGISGTLAYSIVRFGYLVDNLYFVMGEIVFCAGLCIGLSILFREIFNWSNQWLSALSQNTYAAYLFHYIPVIAMQYWMINVNIGPLSKFFIGCAFSIPAAFLMAALIRKIPLVRKII